MILAHEQSRDGRVLSTVRLFVRSNTVTIKALELSNQFVSLHLQICRLSVRVKEEESKGTCTIRYIDSSALQVQTKNHDEVPRIFPNQKESKEEEEDPCA